MHSRQVWFKLLVKAPWKRIQRFMHYISYCIVSFHCSSVYRRPGPVLVKVTFLEEIKVKFLGSCAIE